ncbi:MAG: hypothetical protein IKE81_13285 [Clostridia bacterium]|nr:hypothetical protein [Clostridia bacterium]
MGELDIDKEPGFIQGPFDKVADPAVVDHRDFLRFFVHHPYGAHGDVCHRAAGISDVSSWGQMESSPPLITVM